MVYTGTDYILAGGDAAVLAHTEVNTAGRPDTLFDPQRDTTLKGRTGQRDTAPKGHTG